MKPLVNGSALGAALQNLSDSSSPAPIATSSRNGLTQDSWLLSGDAKTSNRTPERESGIIPGIIAASIFICLLLGLYTILWKCMVAAPKRQRKKPQNKVPRREHSRGKTSC
ncbi:uncharacterized protein SB:CB288 [Latimeria chalumnae]|uniref:uncharacterized protein SB:CB288 n=1 Tax=Latimeria chalumnae TaxID=7897 RepID=UPI0006D8DB21|nr:PREDICTED: uncharacterized protein LOC106703648 [Latimeria chalumnae]|eukprot:XP_014344419.1 PREDICTED: uncharacterized protein LOC106703648 [Latimeria chalumnae]